MSDLKDGWNFEILETAEERLNTFYQTLSNNQNMKRNQNQSNCTNYTPKTIANIKTDNAKALVNKADALYFNGQYAQAEVYYKKAIEAYGNNVEAAVECSYCLAQIYEKQSRLEEAEDLYREIFVVTKNLESKSSLNAQVLSKLAVIYNKLGKHEESELLYINLITRTSKDMLYEDIQFVENSLNSYLAMCTDSNKILRALDLKKKIARIKTQKFGYAI